MHAETAVPDPPRLRIRQHAASAGLIWVRQGLRLFARQPLMLVVLVGLGPLLLSTLQVVVPAVGNLVAAMLAPAVSLGMLAVCRCVRDGEPARIANYLQALEDPVARRHLLQLGVYYALFAGLVALILLLTGTTGGVAPPTPTPASPAGADATAMAIPGSAVLALLAVLVPFAMTVWFAPVLCGWHGMPAPKALFFSFFACWRNRGAIFLNLAALLGLWAIGLMVVGALIDVLNAKSGLAPYLLLAPLVFLVLAVFQASHLVMIDAVIDTGVKTEADDVRG